VIHDDTKTDEVMRELALIDVRPLTPTLSPEYGGEGVNAVARNEAIRGTKP